MEKGVISIFLKKENILLKIKDNSTKAQIIDELKHKLPELKKFYKEEQTPILVTGKNLNESERVEIKNIIVLLFSIIIINTLVP